MINDGRFNGFSDSCFGEMSCSGSSSNVGFVRAGGPPENLLVLGLPLCSVLLLDTSLEDASGNG